MPLFRRNDREAVGTAGVVFALIAMMFGFFAFVVAAHADNKKTGAPAGAVQVSLSEFAITPASIAAPLNGKLSVTQRRIGGAQLQHPGHERPHEGPAARRLRDRRSQGLEGRELHRRSARSPGHQQPACRRRS